MLQNTQRDTKQSTYTIKYCTGSVKYTERFFFFWSSNHNIYITRMLCWPEPTETTDDHVVYCYVYEHVNITRKYAFHCGASQLDYYYLLRVRIKRSRGTATYDVFNEDTCASCYIIPFFEHQKTISVTR